MTKETTVLQTVDYVTENKQLLTQLTKRNEQYVFELDKALQSANVAVEKRHEIKHTLMSELVVAQKTGKTARQLYGTVAQQVKIILEGPKEDFSKPSPDWQLFIDGALLLGSFFMLVAGLQSTGNQGVVAMLLNYIFAGFAMLMITKSSPRYSGEYTFKTKKALLKYVLFTTLGMLVWVGGMVGLTVLPLPFNVVLPSVYYLIVGALTLALRFYLKKVWKIRGVAF